MPAATIGGVSLILYGMISAVGVRNVVENQVDFAKSRNVIIAAMIMSLALGIHFSKAGAIVFTVGQVTVSLSGLADRGAAGQRLRLRQERTGRSGGQLQGVMILLSAFACAICLRLFPADVRSFHLA